MKKYFFDVVAGVPRTSDGQATTAQDSQQPTFTLSQEDIINIQLVSDSSNTKYDLLDPLTVATYFADADYQNPGIPLSMGNTDWTNSVGSEYYHSLTRGEPDTVAFDSIDASEGTIGSLAAGEWGYDATLSRLYVRLSDSTAPSTKASSFITVTYVNADATPLAIESTGDVFNLTGSWYDTVTETWRDPVIGDGELSFSVNANTINFYDKLGGAASVSGFSEVAFYIPDGGDVAYQFKIKFNKTFFKNRLLSSGESPLELIGVDVYTKAEILVLLGTKVSVALSSSYPEQATVLGTERVFVRDGSTSKQTTIDKIVTYISSVLSGTFLAKLFSTFTEKTTLVGADTIAINDSAASFAPKEATLANLLAYVSSEIGAIVVLQGDWNADTNTPDITGTTTTGYAWRVSVAGSTDLGGITDWAVGDLAVKTATGWLKIDNEDIAALWGNIEGTISDQSDVAEMLNNGLIDPETNATIVWTPTALVPGTVTIAPIAAEFKFNISGVQYSKTVLQSVTLPDTSGLHYCYFDNTGTLVTSMSFWDLLVTSPVRAVYWNATTKLGFEMFESHTSKMPALLHMEHHLVEGTQYEDGLIPVGYTLDTASDAAISHTAPSGHIWDEDLRSAITAQLINDYTLFYRTGLEVNNEWSWDIASILPVKHTAGVADYNKNTAGTWGQEPLATLKYINFFGTAIPAIATDFQKILIQGTLQHDSQVDAEGSNYIAEIPGWANVLTEFRPITQFTYRYKSGDGGTANVRLVSVQNIAKSNVKITSSATTNTDVNAIHVNVAGEISVLTEKTFIHDDDTIIIEDNENGGVKKHIKGSVINSMTGTGWIIPPELSINADTTKFDISAGYGFIFSYNNSAIIRTFVNYAGATAQTITYLLTNPTSNVSIDSTGAIIQTTTLPTDIESREKLYVGALLHVNQTNLDSVQNEAIVSYDDAQTIRDLALALGVINKSGNIFSANGANLNIDKSVGTFFRLYGNYSTNQKSPNIVASSALSPASFLRGYYSGSAWVYDTVTTTTIPVTQYNNITSGLVSVSSNKFLIIAIYIYPGTNRVIVDYGQTQYDTIEDAQTGLSDAVLEDDNITSASLRCKLLVKTNATDLSDTSEAKFIEMDKFGQSGTAGGASGASEVVEVTGTIAPGATLNIIVLDTATATSSAEVESRIYDATSGFELAKKTTVFDSENFTSLVGGSSYDPTDFTFATDTSGTDIRLNITNNTANTVNYGYRILNSSTA